MRLELSRDKSNPKWNPLPPEHPLPCSSEKERQIEWRWIKKILRKMMLRWGNHSLKRETSPIFWKIRTPSRKGNIKAGWTSARNKSLSSNSQIGKTSSIKLRETNSSAVQETYPPFTVRPKESTERTKKWFHVCKANSQGRFGKNLSKWEIVRLTWTTTMVMKSKKIAKG